MWTGAEPWNNTIQRTKIAEGLCHETEPLSCSWSFSAALIPTLGYAVDRPDLLHGQSLAISEFDQVPALSAKILNGFPQTFQLEVPEYSILHGTPDTIRTEQHRFKLTFTQMPMVPLVLRLFPLPILLQESATSFALILAGHYR